MAGYVRAALIALGFLLGSMRAVTIAQSPAPLPALHYAADAPVVFATREQLAGYRFAWGPSDGTFGAIPAGDGKLTFFATGGSVFDCNQTRGANQGVFTFTGTLERVTGGDGCRKLFGPGYGPPGWTFDRNYAGGGQVVRFAAGGKSGWLMPFHAEWWWDNPARPDRKCAVGNGSSVRCFYGSLGLAISTDNGRSFKVAGEIVQPSQPRSVFMGGGKNMETGYGSFVVADANGKHLDNPPADPSSAYFYVFFGDSAPGLRGACASFICLGVARASYNELIAAALSGDPHRVARAFRKYDGASPDPWTQPATSDSPDNSGTAGTFAPLWTNEAAYEAEVLYDRAFDVYLASYQFRTGIKVRASHDLIHWSDAIGPTIEEPGRNLVYPTLVGETGDPTIGGAAPRLYFSSFPIGAFPDCGGR